MFILIVFSSLASVYKDLAYKIKYINKDAMLLLFVFNAYR